MEDLFYNLIPDRGAKLFCLMYHNNEEFLGGKKLQSYPTTCEL